MDPTQAANRAEAERSLAIATKLLAVRDLVGSKRFAELALDADPRLSDDRADQILAVADVLLASQKRINNHLDWYSILQLPHPGHSPNSNSNPNDNDYLLKCHYRRLSLLLHPDRNRSPGADSAFKLVVDAYNVLSDPAKRSLFDAELRISDNMSWGSSPAAGGDGEAGAASFWTLCPSCCHVHQYGRAYLNKTLRCQTCRRAFNAAELQALPTIVPGTDMYYATWGFFPLGFANLGSTDWKPFVSVHPGGGGGPHQNQPQADWPAASGGGRGSAEQGGRNKKKTARKKVMSRPKGRMFGNQVNFGDATDSKDDDDSVVEEEEEEEEEARGININEAAKGIGEDDIDMIIDLDGTDDMLGNLHNLPFMKDDGINLHSGGF